MTERTVLRVVRLVLVVLAGMQGQSLLAVSGTVAVGNCLLAFPKYATIQAAVNGVPPGGTVAVCPGIYPEQVVITQPLTLRGVISGTSGASVIASPAGGVATNLLGLFAAQVLVQGTTGVSIQDITVDGANNGISVCAPVLVGVLWENASGTISHVTTRNQTLPTLPGCGSGQGIRVRADSGLTSNVTIQNNNVHDYQYEGIRVSLPGASATISGNTIRGVLPTQTAANGIDVAFGGAATVSNNQIIDGIWSPDVYPDFFDSTWGILIQCSAGVTVTGNTVGNTQSGIVATGSSGSCAGFPNPNNNIITSNRVFGTQTYEGIYVCGNSNQIINNTINGNSESGIDLDASCNPGAAGIGNTLSQNKITEACTGLLVDPNTSGTIMSLNNFFGTTYTQISGVIGANACDAEGPGPAPTKGGLPDVP